MEGFFSLLTEISDSPLHEVKPNIPAKGTRHERYVLQLPLCSVSFSYPSSLVEGKVKGQEREAVVAHFV